MKKLRKISKGAAFLVLALLLLQACSDDPVGPGEQLDPVVIGMIADTTRANERAYYHAAKTASVIINQYGGEMESRPLEIAVEPAGGNAGAAVNNLLNNNANLVALLTCGSADSYAAAGQINSGSKITLISGRALSDELTGVSPWFHRLVPSALYFGQAYADQAQELGVFRVSVALEENDIENADLISRFTQFHPGDFTIVNFRGGEKAESGEIDQMLSNSPEAVFLAVSDATLLASLLHQLKARARSDIYYLLSSNLKESLLLQTEAGFLAGTINNVPRSVGITPAGDYGSRAYKYFAPEIEYRTGEQPVAFTPHYFDAAYLIALTVERAWQSASLENIETFRDVMNQNIRAVADMTPEDLDVDPADRWNNIREEIANEPVNYTGASGDCEIDAAGNTLCPLEVWTVKKTGTGLQHQTISMLYQ